MSFQQKLQLLQQIIDTASEIKVKRSGDNTFQNWKNFTERTLVRIFGENSFEVSNFRKKRFYYSGITIGKNDYSKMHKDIFEKNLKSVLNDIQIYINEMGEDKKKSPLNTNNMDKFPNSLNKVFISHSSKDSNVVEEIIEILESIGLNSTQIFCSSFKGYGIDLGENFLTRLRNELNQNILVIFMLSNNFYESPICLCEMGATWVKTNFHIPILIPPFSFNEIKGVFPLTQGLKVNDAEALNQLKDQIEQVFELENTLTFSTWERKRNRILDRINHKVAV